MTPYSSAVAEHARRADVGARTLHYELVLACRTDTERIRAEVLHALAAELASATAQFLADFSSTPSQPPEQTR